VMVGMTLAPSKTMVQTRKRPPFGMVRPSKMMVGGPSRMMVARVVAGIGPRGGECTPGGLGPCANAAARSSVVGLV
jgi:hypothetical protein